MSHTPSRASASPQQKKEERMPFPVIWTKQVLILQPSKCVQEFDPVPNPGFHFVLFRIGTVVFSSPVSQMGGPDEWVGTCVT